MRRSTILAMIFVSAALALASGASAARIEGEVDVSTALQILGVSLLAMFSIAVTLNSSYVASILRELFRRRPYSREAEDWGRVRSALLTQVLFLILIALALLLRREAETAGVEEVGGFPGAVQQNMTEQLSNATSAMLVSSAAGAGTIEQPLTALAAVLVVIPIVAIAVAMLRYKEEVYSRAESPVEVKEVAAVALERLRAGEDLRAVICSLYEDFCRILEKRGFTVTRYMTAREIMAGANTAFPWLPKEALTTLTDLFEKARYSDHAVTSEDKLAAEEALSEIAGALSREQVV